MSRFVCSVLTQMSSSSRTASEMERKELQSFEQQIPNKQRLQDEEHERVIEAAAQRAAKEAQVKSNLDTNMLTEFEAKRKSLSHPRRKSSESLKLENVRSPQEANKSLDLDASDMDYVIDEIPEEICSPEKETGSAADTLCGIGVMLSQNAAGLYVVVEISSSVCILCMRLISILLSGSHFYCAHDGLL